MIGDGWDDAPAVRPGPADDDLGVPEGLRRVAVVTGTRAEFGLLRPVMRAIASEPSLALLAIASGAHLIAPAETFREVKRDFRIAEIVPMQIAGRTGRAEDVESLARGVARFGRAFTRLRPDWVVVLGDRIEALAAGLAASVGGFALAHIHGGDRAEGVADEAMRHALTKLAHLHLPATPQSRDRIVRMGEDPSRVHVVGSPAIDELAPIAPMDDAQFQQLGAPSAIVLLHPVGQPAELEEAGAAGVLEGLRGERVLALEPNFDPGRDGVLTALRAAHQAGALHLVSHLPRAAFVGLLKRLAATPGPQRGVLVGNSSAGLIEAAAVRIPVVDIGPRQGGRERCANVVHIAHAHAESVRQALTKARSVDLSHEQHPYGDGHAGSRIAQLLARVSPAEPGLLRKRCAY